MEEPGTKHDPGAKVEPFAGPLEFRQGTGRPARDMNAGFEACIYCIGEVNYGVVSIIKFSSSWQASDRSIADRERR